jgi:hypothetical protein
LRLTLKKDLLETATDDEIRESINEEIGWINDEIRYIQSRIGEEKRNLQ